MSLLNSHGWAPLAILRAGHQTARSRCTKAQRMDPSRSCQLEEDRHRAGKLQAADKAEGTSACAGPAAKISGFVSEPMKHAQFKTLQCHTSPVSLSRPTSRTRAAIAGISKQRLQPPGFRLLTTHEGPGGFHSLAQSPSPKMVNCAENMLKRRLVEMYIEEDNTSKATRDHWARSQVELNWLKSGAEKAVTGRCGPEPCQKTSTMCAQTRFEKQRMIDEVVAKWVDDYVANQKPLAYILGDVPFGDLTFAVRPPILIPRCETEEWVSRLSHMMGSYFAHCRLHRDTSSPSSLQDPGPSFPAAYKLLDLCTGSGCISNFLAHHHPMVHSIGVDVDQDAIDLAKQNARAYGLTRGRTYFLQNDIFSPTFTSELQHASQARDGFDMIISNPPYITQADYQTLAPSVKNWESSIALIGDRPPPRVGKDDQLFLPSGGQRGIHQSFTSACPPSMSSCNPVATATEEDRLKRLGDTKELQSCSLQTDSSDRSQDGLDFYRQIITLVASGTLLRNKPQERCTLSKHSGHELQQLPRIVLEVGKGQAELVKKLLLEHLYERGVVRRAEIWKDFAGIERTVVGY